VALASDSHLLVGIDVAAPQQLRRGLQKGGGGEAGNGKGGGPLLAALAPFRGQLTDEEVRGAAGLV
jgi:hypothetical protein